MLSYNEAVDKDYNKKHKEQSEKSQRKKDNSMFGKEILEELGIYQHINEAYEDELLM